MNASKIGSILIAAVSLLAGASLSAVSFKSSNFSIEGSVGDSIAGPQSSTSYKMVSSGGQSLGGTSASKSYKLGLGYIPELESSIQLSVQQAGLSGYWPLDSAVADGVAFDTSIYSNNGRYSNPANSQTGKVGKAWATSGGTSQVTIPNNPQVPTGSSMAVSTWVNFSQLQQSGLVVKWDSMAATAGSWAFTTTEDGSNIRLYMKAAGSDAATNYVSSTNAGLSAGNWHHLAAVYDGSLANENRIKLYKDGVILSSITTGVIPATITESTHDIALGTSPGLSRSLAGAMDEVKLYQVPVSSTDIRAEYDAGEVGSRAGASFGTVVPGISETKDLNTMVQTDASAYQLAISQSRDLTANTKTIDPISGSVSSPVTWSEGFTKGLGFSVLGASANAPDSRWQSGGAYAALPLTATDFYSRSGLTGGQKDTIDIRLRLDTPSSQPDGQYSNTMTITGTMLP